MLEKMVEEIDSYIKLYNEPPYGREIEGTVELLEKFKYFIKTYMRGSWIPVDERLPEKDGWYLCTLDGLACGEEQSFVTMCEFTNGAWDEAYDDGVIIAWQPLPEPYKTNK